MDFSNYEDFIPNICILVFIIITLSMVVVSVIINLCEKYIPVFITRAFRYGKFACRQNNVFVEYMEVPKSYFKHFYLTAALFFYPLAFNEVFAVYICNWDPEIWFLNILDFFCGKNRKANVPITRVLIAVFLMLLQVFRRFYDTHFVSVFSPKAVINLTHYIIGMIYYPLVMLIILGEAPIFAQADFETHLSWNEIRLIDWISIVIFFWAWYHQHTATVILANLRKNKKGDVVSSDYKIPSGDWFEYLTQPHSAAEILIYISLTVILSGNKGWIFVLAWVISNQVETMLLSHWWYKNNFKQYPKKRKALIPFIY